MKKITGQEAITEILIQLPEAEDILRAYGLHCVGCSIGAYESLFDGCRGHGFSDDEIKKVIDDLNLCLSDKKKGNVILTTRAAKKITHFQKEQNKEGFGVLVKAKKTQGQWQYSLDFRKQRPKLYSKIHSQGINLFLSKETQEHLLNHKIDYLVTDTGEGFKFEKI